MITDQLSQTVAKIENNFGKLKEMMNNISFLEKYKDIPTIQIRTTMRGNFQKSPKIEIDVQLMNRYWRVRFNYLFKTKKTTPQIVFANSWTDRGSGYYYDEPGVMAFKDFSDALRKHNFSPKNLEVFLDAAVTNSMPEYLTKVVTGMTLKKNIEKDFK